MRKTKKTQMAMPVVLEEIDIESPVAVISQSQPQQTFTPNVTIPNHAELSYKRDLYIDYRQTVDLARNNDLPSIEALVRYFMDKCGKLAQPGTSKSLYTQNTQKIMRQQCTKLLLDIQHIRKFALENPRANIRQYTLWKPFIDHNILQNGTWFGPLSVIDTVKICQASLAYDTNVKGIQSLKHQNWGVVTANENGYQIAINGEVILMSGECLHQLLATGIHHDNVAYDEKCAFGTVGMLRLNGYTIVLPIEQSGVDQDLNHMNRPNFFVDSDGEVHMVTSPLRISMPAKEYQAVVLSQALARYGQEGYEREYNAGVQCFDDPTHVPANETERDYYFHNLWLENKSETERAKYFLPAGALAGFTPDAMHNLDLFTKQYPEHKRLFSERQANRKASNSPVSAKYAPEDLDGDPGFDEEKYLKDLGL